MFYSEPVVAEVAPVAEAAPAEETKEDKVCCTSSDLPVSLTFLEGGKEGRKEGREEGREGKGQGYQS